MKNQRSAMGGNPFLTAAGGNEKIFVEADFSPRAIRRRLERHNKRFRKWRIKNSSI